MQPLSQKHGPFQEPKLPVGSDEHKDEWDARRSGRHPETGTFGELYTQVMKKSGSKEN